VRSWTIATALALALGCGSSPDAADAGAPTRDAAAPFETPAPPAAPVFTPCPDGWAEAADADGVTLCEPPSAAPCAAGAVRFVGQASCAPIGAACPPGDWAAVPDGAPPVYVRAGATGGDGSVVRPYGSIQDAIVRAPPGGAVLVARGTYDESIDLYGGVQVIGACAAETILAPTTGTRAVRAAETNAALRDVTIRPAADATGVDVTGEATLSAVVIEGAADDGVFVHDGGALTADALVARDIRATGPQLGRGLTVTEGRVDLSRAIFERCPGGGLLVSIGATVDASAVTVRASGEGLQNRPQIIAQGAGSLLRLGDSLVEDATGSGVLVNEGGTAHLDQVVIREMRGDPARDVAGGGMLARTGGRLEARRVRVVDSDLLGAGAGEGSALTLEDVLIARIAAIDAGGDTLGFGVTYGGSDLVVRRVVVTDVELTGIQIEEATATFEDLRVARTGSHPSPPFSPMGFAQADATTVMRRVRIEDARGAGLYSLRSALTLEDALIADTPSLALGRFGRGLEVLEGRATLSRVRIEGAREVAIHVLSGAEVELTDARVVDTRGRDCQETTCADAPGGLGLAAIGGALSAGRFTVEGARLCGAMVASDGELDLRDGEITEATVGTCVQVDGYDVGRLTEDVQYRDNGINVDATDHSLPPPPDPLSSIDL